MTSAKIADGAVTRAKLSASGGSNGEVLELVSGNLTWSSDEQGGLKLPFTGTTASAASAFTIENSAGGSVRGRSGAAAGRGVHGVNSATSGQAMGVHGENASGQGIGVLGNATAGGGQNYGVRGESATARAPGCSARTRPPTALPRACSGGLPVPRGSAPWGGSHRFQRQLRRGVGGVILEKWPGGIREGHGEQRHHIRCQGDSGELSGDWGVRGGRDRGVGFGHCGRQRPGGHHWLRCGKVTRRAWRRRVRLRSAASGCTPWPRGRFHRDLRRRAASGGRGIRRRYQRKNANPANLSGSWIVVICCGSSAGSNQEPSLHFARRAPRCRTGTTAWC